jgi:acylphosphatase
VIVGEKRVRVTIRGRVQGVGFRASCQREAQVAGVRGWVRNEWDGSVEALFEGSTDAVDRMMRWCYSGPRMAEVESVEVAEASEAAPAGSFRVR